MDRRALLAASLVGLLLVAGAFAFVDFHAMESMTDGNSSVGTAQSNHSTAPKNAPLTLVVRGDAPVADRIGDELAADLSGTWSIERADEPTDSAGPILVVEVAESDIRYNPVTPSAEVTARFGFVGSGNATLASKMAAGERPVVFSNRDPYAVDGRVVVSDRSRGIVSWPGYQRHVTESLSAELVRALTSAPGM